MTSSRAAPEAKLAKAAPSLAPTPEAGQHTAGAKRERDRRPPGDDTVHWLLGGADGQPIQRKPIDAGYGDIVAAARSGPSALHLQRKCARCDQEEALQKQRTEPSSTAVVQRMPADPATAATAPWGGGAATPGGPGLLQLASAGVQHASAPIPHLEQIQQAFGPHDVSHVRAVVGGAGAAASASMGAEAYTIGDRVAFRSTPDLHLAAHEAAHVVQQRSGVQLAGGVGEVGDRYERQADAVADRVVQGRSAAALLDETAAGSSSARSASRADHELVQRKGVDRSFLRAGWKDVNELGIVYKEGAQAQQGGAELNRTPGSDLIRWLPQNTKVFILKHHPTQGVYAVTVVPGTGSAGAGELGYINEGSLWRHLPDPDAIVLQIPKGTTAITIAQVYYKGKGFDKWGEDLRYVVNALAWVNANAKHNGSGKPGIRKGDVANDWTTAGAIANVYVWLPGVEYLRAIYDDVVEHAGGTGSPSAELLRWPAKMLHDAEYALAFLGGIIHGFFASLYDAVTGTLKLGKDLIVSIFTASIIDDAKELWQSISKVSWEEIKKAVGAWADKWEQELKSDSAWVSGHAHGYLTGYVMAEAAQMLLTGGAAAELKSAILGSKLGEVVKATKAYRVFAQELKKAAGIGGKVSEAVKDVGAVVKATRVFKALNEARKWVADALLLGAETVANLSLDAINLLGTLSEEMLNRLRALSQPLKHFLLGCSSPCKVDLRKIVAYLDELAARGASKAKTLTTVQDVLNAIPSGFAKEMIEDKLKRHAALLEAIERGGITADDLAVMSMFKVGADARDPASAYYTFTRTLNMMVPAKMAPDIDAFNKLAETMIKLSGRPASAIKGPMFETFAKLKLDKFRNLRFERATFSRDTYKFLRKTRTSDGFINGELWDFKHTFDKVPRDQVEDYLNLLQRKAMSTEKQAVQSVHYLFPTRGAADLNADLIELGFEVWFVEPPDKVIQLKPPTPLKGVP